MRALHREDVPEVGDATVAYRSGGGSERADEERGES
jgi:hypothetical protein